MEEHATGLSKDGIRAIHENIKGLNKNKTQIFTAIVVDDNLDIVQLFSQFLELEGISVVGKGYDGKDAVTLYEKFRPDVTFLDIMMPKYDGFYALENIRKINEHAKIMMVTADLREDTAIKLNKYDSIALVYKPFEFGELIKTLDNLMRSGLVDSMAYQGVNIPILKK